MEWHVKKWRRAFVALPLFCASPEALLNSAANCSGNGVFIEAAKACLAKLNTEEADWGKKVDEIAKNAKHGQSKDTSAAREGYSTTVQAMNHLHALAEQGKAELLAYEPFLALPSNEAARILRNDGSVNQSEAMKASCYSEGMNGVRANTGEFVKKIAMYDKRRKEALAAAKELGINLGNLQAVTSIAKPAKAGVSKQPVPAGKSPRKDSKITGKINKSKLP